MPVPQLELFWVPTAMSLNMLFCAAATCWFGWVLVLFGFFILDLGLVLFLIALAFCAKVDRQEQCIKFVLSQF